MTVPRLLLDAETEYTAARAAKVAAENVLRHRGAQFGGGAPEAVAYERAAALVAAWRTILESKGVAP